MHRYKLLTPFRVSDTEVVPAGEILELPDDVAALHAGKLERQPDAAGDQATDATTAA